MRPLALVLFLAASAVIVGCGPTVKCGPGNCSGCCDSSGACQLGSANSACGTGGLICNACFAGQTCSLGLCNSAGSGGGNGSGGGFGGGTGGGSGGGGSGGGGFGGGTGGGFGGGTGGGAPSAWETWCRDSYVPALCEAGARCGAYANASICTTGLRALNICMTTPAHRDGRTVLDNTGANNCLASVNGSCDAYNLYTCVAVRGTGTLNAPCYGSGECEPNLYCAMNSCPGTCQPRTPIGSTTTGECAEGGYEYGNTCQPLVPLGQSCAPVSPQTSDRQCVTSGFCSSTKICTARRTTGQSCGGAGECSGFLTCWGGVCGAAGNLGAPCDSARACKYGYKCGATNVCVTTGAVGAPCANQYTDCEPGLICDIPAGQTQGTCGQIKTIGQSCSYGNYQCGFLGPLYCTGTIANPAGICAMKKGLGASCMGYEECSSGSCSSGVCAGCVDPTP